MNSWKDLKKYNSNVIAIENCVAEYDVWDVVKAPAARYKVKIYENMEGKFCGYANLLVQNDNREYINVIGRGDTQEEAFNNTLDCFYSLIEAFSFEKIHDGVSVIYSEDPCI